MPAQFLDDLVGDDAPPVAPVPAPLAVHLNAARDSHQATLKRELESYRNEPRIPMSARTKRDAEGVEKSVYTDPLMWWQNTGSIKYPALAQIA